jgi:aryl-alcohol dehydrogenase-like predicted oxidoreductase
MSRQDAADTVQESLDPGINFLDIASNYGYGTTEARPGKALKKTDRSKVVINAGFRRRIQLISIILPITPGALEGSLRRLQTDYVDSPVIHNPPVECLDGNHDAHYEVVERLMEEGINKACGASLDANEEMQLFMNTTNGNVIEAFFNILHQDAARAFEAEKARNGRYYCRDSPRFRLAHR